MNKQALGRLFLGSTRPENVSGVQRQAKLYDVGTTVPTDGAVGYAKGCIFIKTDGSAGTTFYVNEGTSASADFNVSNLGAVTATAAELNQLDGNILADVATGAGAGITSGTGTICEHSVVKVGGLYKTEMLVDLTGLASTATDGDIIGAAAGGAAYLCQVTAARNGTIIAGRMMCMEVAAGGDDDMALYSATEATGAYDGAIADLAETLLLDHGAWTAGQLDELAALPAADEYLYFVAKGGDTGAAYTGGIYLVELWGK